MWSGQIVSRWCGSHSSSESSSATQGCLPARSPAVVFHVIEGAAAVQVEDQRFALAEADTCCVPGYRAMTLTNASLDTPSFLFIADETPLHKKLGIFETRA